MKQRMSSWVNRVMAMSAVWGSMTVMAQVPSIVQIPFGKTIAGIAPGGSSTACSASSDIPQFTGMHLGDGCLATQATLNGPYSATVDSLGNVYIGDYNAYSVRVVYQGGAALAAAIIAANPQATNLVPQAGHIYTLAGSRTATITTTTPTGGGSKQYFCNGAGSGPIGLSSNGDGCPGGEAYLKPRTMTLDKDGNIFFTSGSGSAPIRVLYIEGAAAAALINKLQSVTAKPGYVYSIIKSSANGYNGDGSLATGAAVATFSPRDVAVDSNENVYLSDGTNSFTAPAYASNNNIRLVNGTTGIITTFAGSAGCAQGSTNGCAGTYTGDGGPATAATFNSPYAIFLDQSNNLYIADYNNARLRVVYAGGTVPGLSNLTVGNVYTVVGGGALTTTGIPATQIKFGTLYNAGIDSAGNLYVNDATSKLLWKVDAKTGIGIIIGGGASSTTAGAYCSGSTGPQATNKMGDGCPALQASIVASGRVTIDNSGNIFETENSNSVIREFSYNTLYPATVVGSQTVQPLAFDVLSALTLTGESYTLQGGVTSEFSDSGNGTCALNTSIAAKTVCTFNVQFTPSQAGLRAGSLQFSSGASALVSTFLNGDGVAANLSLDPATQTILGNGLTPSGVGTDVNGNIYISDTGTGTIVKVATVGGTATTLITGLSKPSQIAVDGKGNIYVADTGNNRVAQTGPAGGTVIALGVGLNAPKGVAVDGQGNVFIADTGNNRIVEITAAGGQLALNVSGLSGPSAVAIDALGDLFIADTENSRIVELPVNGTQTVANLGTAIVTPVGVSVDAAGDLYIADTASLQVLEFPVGSTLSNVLATGLTSPNGLAVDPNGSIYVSDTHAAGALAFNRSRPMTSYPPTNVGQSNIAALNVTNSGNAALIFNGSQLTTATGDTSSFSISSAATNGCTLGGSIASGAECALTATFQPVAIGSASVTEVPVTNAANNTATAAILSGNGVNLISTTTRLAVTAPTTTPIYYGQAVTVSATITPASTGGAAPTGTVIFTVDGRSQPSQSLGSSGVAQITQSLGVGIHAVTVSYSGDSIYASSSTSLSFTVAKATTATVLKLSTAAQSGAAALTFSATVSSTTATGETGTVSFYSGSTLLSTQAISAQGTAAYVTTVTTYNIYSFTAVYSGDTNFANSTSTVLQPSQDFVVSPASSTIAIAQGGVASMNVALTPLFNYSGTITATCNNLPASSVCAFQPTSVVLAGGISQTISVLIYTNVSSTLAQMHSPERPLRSSGASGVTLGLLLPGALGLLTCLRGGKRRGVYTIRLMMLLMCVVSLMGMGMLSGCSSGNTTQSYVTPVGTQAITVVFSDTANVSHPQSFSFVVNAK
jgi:sugar lactone lactonase YvrE